MYKSTPERSKEIWKGVGFWAEEIKKAGVYERLRHFNDVLTGREAPKGYGEPVLTDIVLDGKNCDIYHTDKERDDSFHRVFVHIKE